MNASSADVAPGPGEPDPTAFQERLDAIRTRITGAGGDPGRVRIVAVTKTFGPPAVRAALGAGIIDVAENYRRELVETAGTIAAELTVFAARPRWHFLGSIQRRDVPKLAPVVAVYEAVDRLEEGEAIARHAPGATVYVEIDEQATPGRAGVRAAEAGPLIARLRALDLDVAGVMTIAPPGGRVAAEAAFAVAARVADENGLSERSMGMSDDLESAIAAGSTAIRIGRALFGGRGPRARGATMDP